jgi:hypoxanthine phosphoribosyltransferase
MARRGTALAGGEPAGMAPTERAVPAHLQVLFTPAVIQAAIEPVAASVGDWCRSVLAASGEQVLALCVLRGGVFFFSDLLQRVPVSVEPAFCRCASYAKDANGQPDPRVDVDLYGLGLAGRSVLLVDNICDTGRTLQALAARCAAEGAAAVRSITLVYRRRGDPRHRPDWHVFAVNDPAWLAGYGLRDGNRLMNYPTVYRVAAD